MKFLCQKKINVRYADIQERKIRKIEKKRKIKSVVDFFVGSLQIRLTCRFRPSTTTRERISVANNFLSRALSYLSECDVLNQSSPTKATVSIIELFF
jgi:hypothetical protein